MNDEFSYLPFRKELVKRAYDTIRSILPPDLKKKKLFILTDGYEISELIPFADNRKRFEIHCERPIVSPIKCHYLPTKGLLNRHIALWQSHGYYFEQSLNRWEWQRARIFETVEDLYTQSFVMPFLTPMLQNAGAYVFSPRERDTNRHELIADNDNADTYFETGTEKVKWENGSTGFAHTVSVYTGTRNPFDDGSFRQTKTTTDPRKEIQAHWYAPIPQTGKYAVYIAYRTVKNSTDDALYTVYHKGGKTQFKVNQSMGGGTWIYLGHFDFAKGENAHVELSNLSRKNGKTVTADAVKIGGGYGNIARRVDNSHIDENPGNSSINYSYTTSGYPRFTEAARYWLQWAGFPEKVYSPSQGKNDYTDDYKCRGEWVNYLAGGSDILPDSSGLNVPLDLAFAFHSDAGTTKNDSIIGSLGIYFTGKGRKTYGENTPRQVSRYLTDVVLTQIADDIRETYEPEWNRRGMWNKSYFEARVPEVPTMLLELLSHQNFADMRYGSDPRFKFLVSRAIYKAILRHVSFQYGRPCVVQPLPVEGFSAVFAERDDEVRLQWHGVEDPLEASASPTGYVLYTRIGDGDFDNGVPVDGTSTVVRQEPCVIYSYRVTATNAGGESFPSETVAACRMPDEKGTVLIVNGFDRVSAPLSVRADSLAGFYTDIDGGVPDRQDISFIGAQHVFDMQMAKCEVDSIALGACACDYETEVIGGNTFDYPALHGRSVAGAGYSFCSASVRAVERGEVSPDGYSAVDLILGEQRSTTIGRGVTGYAFKTFSPELQAVLRRYMAGGGALFVSGSYVATDLWTGENTSDDDRRFAEEVLHYTYDGGRAAQRGRMRVVTSHPGFSRDEYRYVNEYRPDRYRVESPDALRPAGAGAFSVMRYVENGRTAGVASEAGGTFVMGFPFESIESDVQRDRLMRDVLDFLLKQKDR